MASPSRTQFADWVARPAVCHYCQQRVTLKQAHRGAWDERTNTGRISHVRCDPWVCELRVEAR